MECHALYFVVIILYAISTALIGIIAIFVFAVQYSRKQDEGSCRVVFSFPLTFVFEHLDMTLTFAKTTTLPMSYNCWESILRRDKEISQIFRFNDETYAQIIFSIKFQIIPNQNNLISFTQLKEPNLLHCMQSYIQLS